MTAYPAEPENPLMYSRGSQYVRGAVLAGVSDRGVHRRAQCTRSGGCPQKGPLRISVSKRHCADGSWGCTVDINLALVHELAELGEPLRGVDLLHVEEAADGGGVESSLAVEGHSRSYRRCGSRVRAQEEAREQHRQLSTRRDLVSTCCSRCSCMRPSTGRTCPASLAPLPPASGWPPSQPTSTTATINLHSTAFCWRIRTLDAVTMLARLVRSLPRLPAHPFS